jgi:hypothetical protein
MCGRRNKNVLGGIARGYGGPMSKKRKITTSWNGRDVSRGRWVEPTDEEKRTLEIEDRARRAAKYAGELELADVAEKTPVLSDDAEDVLEEDLPARVAVSRAFPFSLAPTKVLLIGTVAVGGGFLIGRWLSNRKKSAPPLPSFGAPLSSLPAWAVT